MDGFVHILLLDGKGGARALSPEELTHWIPESGILWLHLDLERPEARRWLEEESGLDPVIREALMAEETRPRSVASHDGLLLMLRGVNLNEGADPEDMVALRVWAEATRIFTVRRRRLMAVADLREELESGEGPRTSSELLIALCDHLTDRMAGVMEALDDAVDEMEEKVLMAESHDLRGQISEVRRRAIGMRRYLAPQRDVMGRLQSERVSWLDDRQRVHLRELADRTTRYVEDLDSARDRAAVAHEELHARLSEAMNKNTYVLSVVAAIFLPLGLLTGLLGINVGGIPGTDNPWAFLLVCLVLVGLGALEFWWLRRRRWF